MSCNCDQDKKKRDIGPMRKIKITSSDIKIENDEEENKEILKEKEEVKIIKFFMRLYVWM